MNDLWFTSDKHFNHANIIKYENRPFKDVEEMNQTIIFRHNERVKKDDVVYDIGDVGFYASKAREFRGEGCSQNVNELLNLLNGNIIYVCGNHDKKTNKLNFSNHRIIIKKGGLNINLIHDAEYTVIEDDKCYYPLTICGHWHGNIKTKEISSKFTNKIAYCINVGVDNNNFYPFSFDEIMSIYYRWVNNHPRKKEIYSWIRN